MEMNDDLYDIDDRFAEDAPPRPGHSIRCPLKINLRKKKVDIDKIGQEWGALGKEGNDAARLKLRNDLWLCCYDCIENSSDELANDRAHDALTHLITVEFPRLYDSQKGSLSSFIEFRFKNRQLDYYDDSSEYVIIGKDEEGPIRKPWIAISLDEPMSDETDTPIYDSDLVSTPDNAVAEVLFNEQLCALISLMLNMKDHLPKKQQNENRIKFYRMFYAEWIATAAREKTIRKVGDAKESEIFSALHLAFLDHFMSKECRSVAALSVCETKEYGELVPGRDTVPVNFPLPLDVYTVYVGCAASTVSTHRQSYESFIKENLQ